MKQNIFIAVAALVLIVVLGLGIKKWGSDKTPAPIEGPKGPPLTAPTAPAPKSVRHNEVVESPKLKCNRGPAPLPIFGTVKILYPGAGASPISSSAAKNAKAFCKFKFGNTAELVKYEEKNMFGDEAEGCSWMDPDDQYEGEFSDFNTGSKNKNPAFKGLSQVTCNVY